MKCNKCGAELKLGMGFCSECGEKVEEQSIQKRFCRECGFEFAEGAKFCSKCGADLNSEINNTAWQSRPAQASSNYNDISSSAGFESTYNPQYRSTSGFNTYSKTFTDIKDKITFNPKYLFLLIPLAAIFLIFIIIAASTSKIKTEGKVELPISHSSAIGENYEVVMNMFTNKGYKNITLMQDPDLITGWLTKDGSIEEITVAGDNSFQKGDLYYPEAEVVILYHTFSSSSDSSSSTEKNTSNYESTEMETEKESADSATTSGVKTIGLNEEFGNKTIKGSVLEANLNYTNYNDFWTEIPAGSKAIFIKIKMTNISDVSNYVSVGDFNCYVDDVAVESEIISGSDYDYNQNIDPGRSAILGACYVIPANSQSIELEYDPIGEYADRVIIKIK